MQQHQQPYSNTPLRVHVATATVAMATDAVRAGDRPNIITHAGQR